VAPGDTSPPRSFEPADLVGTLFADRFRVLRVVMTGANTAVYDARDDESGRTVTLKLVRPKLAASPSFRDRFDESMRGVAALSHPNIAAVYDWGIARVGDASTAYVVSEHLAGGSLRDMFDRGRRLSPSQALSVGLDVCRALDHAHRRKFVHTELNPSKIVFGDDRRLRVIDFGLAQLLGAPTWEQPDSVPTHVAWYAAPEQALGQPVDGRADVYALGLSLHEAVTGSLPFKSDSTVAALSARIGKLMPVSADLGPLASVLEHAGRPDPEERSTAAEFGKGLLQAASKLPRPEPLPLLSTGLFETPPDQLRSPDDPTGGVNRPGETPPPLVVVPIDEPDEPGSEPESEPELSDAVVDDLSDDIPAAAAVGDELVILPLDADDSAGHRTEDAGGAAAVAASTAAVATAPVTVQMPPTEPEPLPRRRRGFPWKILLGLLVVAALVVLGVLALNDDIFQRQSYPVPELTGMPVAEARNLIAPNDWEIDVQSERSDEQPEVGDVIRTAPAAGVELAEGEPFLMVVSEGPLLRELPESTGKPLSEAQTALAGLRLGVETVEQFDEVVQPGIVISWSVPGDATLAAGSLVEPDTVVQLVISKGPAPRVVPNIIGLSVADATTQLTDLQLTLSQGEQVFSDDFPLGAVVSQSVPEGTEVPRGSDVSVVVSRGPDIVVFPDISAATTFEQAAAILGPAGFQPVLTFGDAQGAIQSVTIEGQPPQVGNTYRRGTVVEFTGL
jgi:beta-lactam-binding protein with PASTA domain/serine/threonine protein kinase